MTLQVIVQKAVPAGEHDDISNLLPQGDVDPAQLETEFRTLIGRVQDEGLQKLLKTIFTGPLYERFIRNPAGMRLHHAYVGGLLHHTVSMAKLAVAMARTIEHVDLDLVITGSLLHDLGKIREISAGLGFPYTTEGRLMGHIAMGALMVNRAAARVPELSRDKLDQLLHIILSHHGDKEKGSPVLCATKEAFIVHYADELDSIMNQFREKEGSDPWEFDKMLQRFLYKV